MIGGFFLKDERMIKPVSFIKGKINSLYLLILYLYIPFTLLHNVLLDIGFYDTAIEYGGKHVGYWSTGQFIRGIVEVVFLAGREPILGAMWFVYVLFMALCYISIVSFVIAKIAPPRSTLYEKARCYVLLGGAIAASFLTHVFDFTIPRFNNVFTAAWLIYVGMQLVQRYKLKFDNWFVFWLSLMIFYSFAVLRGDVHLNRNEFDDIISLTVSSCCALYVLCFLSKRLKGRFAKGMAVIGRDSFYIMGLHFLTFKLGSCSLNAVSNLNLNPADLMAPAHNVLLYIYFVLIGVLMPLAMLWIWRRLKNFIILNKIK